MAHMASADLENQQEATETTPLLSEGYTFLGNPDAEASEKEEEPMPLCGCLPEGHDQEDTMTYDQSSLLSWRILLDIQGSVLDNLSLWMLMVKMISLAGVVTIACVYTGHFDNLDTSKFTKLSTFLNTFVGLMLGFFVSMQMQRWLNSAGAFLDLFDAVKNLQIQLFALGVNPERSATVVRYGLLSVWLLYYDLIHKCQGMTYEQMWADIETKRPGLVKPKEKVLLRMTAEPASCIWTWVSSLVGRMAQDGDIPPMPSPTYGRILMLSQSAHGAIRNVRVNVLVQAPWVYSHMLATLVHCNNVINSLSLGLTLGVIASNLRRTGFTGGAAAMALQDSASSLLLSLAAPFLYQAILEVALAVARPFAHEDGMIPVPRLIVELEKTLNDCKFLADAPPSWIQPAFKKPA